MKKGNKKKLRPKQRQRRQPGIERKMRPRPEFAAPDYRPAGKLLGRVAIVTGGDSGIGRAVAVGFAAEGADVVVSYLNEHGDARETQRLIEEKGRTCVLVAGDVGDSRHCARIVREARRGFGGVDILVNNAAEQHPRERIEGITDRQLERTFRTNIFSMFYLTREALPLLERSVAPSIINTTSVTAYRGSDELVDYAATKGAIVAFTRSLSTQLAKRAQEDRGRAGHGQRAKQVSVVRVNAVAPGPIWTPLIPSTFDAAKVASFGSDVPLGRAGEPAELVGAYVYLASTDSSYVTGQVVHVNGGEVVNG